jgi:adenine-specific DNA-methyltransferase
MASCLTFTSLATRLLDAGAGVGSLTAAAVAELGTRKAHGRTIKATVCELDVELANRLDETLRLCGEYSKGKGIKFDSKVITEDFIVTAVAKLRAPRSGKGSYNCAILNPPYGKLHGESKYRQMLRSVGIEASNLYTAFLSLTVKLLEPNGEMVAIVPRSFCNGPYFKSFRELLLGEMAIDAVHLFKSRTSAFAEDDVLQENIIFHAVKTKKQPKTIKITSSHGAEEEASLQLVTPDRLVNPKDPECFIRLVTDETERHISEFMGKLTSTLEDLGLRVSTGKVVDFRAQSCLRRTPSDNTVPLIHPTHFRDGWIDWPRLGSKKANAITAGKKTASIIIPAGIHVLVKRFSAKEERRRVVAAVFDPARVSCERVGFENRVNYFHADGEGMTLALAKGLTAYLNSSVVDMYFRETNGHTQVNALDLRSMRYPTKLKLEQLGRAIGKKFPNQQELDRMVEHELLEMEDGSAARCAMSAKRRIEEAVSILKAIGLPAGHQNEKSGMVLLGMLVLDVDSPWSDAKATSRRISQLVDHCARQFGSRFSIARPEAFARRVLRQFVSAGLVVPAPDRIRQGCKPEKCFRIAAGAIELFRAYGSCNWDKAIATWSASSIGLRDVNLAALQQITAKLPAGGKVSLKQIPQNLLIKYVVEDFCTRFTPEDEVLYLGGTRGRPTVCREEKLAKLGVTVGDDGKMPDVVIYSGKKKRLLLVSAVAGRTRVREKRYREMKDMFTTATCEFVLVTTFLDRAEMRKHLHDITWETEVWVAEAPAHLIHFNGERFSGS